MLARAHQGGRLTAMTDPEPTEQPRRARREPPGFRPLTVRAVVPVSPRLLRITFAGRDLEGFTVEEPAASVRLLLPASASEPLVVPTWNGNEFLLPGGHRPTIRTFTPRRVDADAGELDLEAVIHGDGVASQWAARAGPGAAAAISGPGRGYAIDDEAPAFLLAGDETALPAICQLLELLPRRTPIQVHIEVGRPDARFALPVHPRAYVAWYDLAPGAPPGDALVAAVRAATLVPGERVWVAGEAAGVQRIRRYLFDEVAKPRAETTVRGYWKHGRAEGPSAEA
jgi:NADPH-dependent ferric siderophore reductase